MNELILDRQRRSGRARRGVRAKEIGGKPQTGYKCRGQLDCVECRDAGCVPSVTTHTFNRRVPSQQCLLNDWTQCHANVANIESDGFDVVISDGSYKG
jgi:hypothetical protein